VDVNEVVRSCVDLMGAQFRDRGLDLRLDLSGGLVPVSGNPFALEEVLLNLLVNARDAVGESGRIRVRTGVTDVEGEPWVSLQVRDSGSGMAPEVMERAEEPFFTTKGPQAGTGLGLTISRSIVDRFGGTMDLASEVGRGTTVTVCLPPLARGQGLPP
jgi:signal transduction histidine kinase